MKSHNEVLGLNYDTAINVVTSDSDSVRRNEPGELASVKAREGYRVYKYMKAEEAFAIGQVAMISAVLDDADVDAAAATTEKTLTGTGDFTADEFDDGTFPDGLVHINANTTGFGQTRAIVRNRGSANIITLDQNWGTALTSSSDYLTWSQNYVSLADTDDVSQIATKVKGVAISAVTDENWSWFQVGGFCPLIRCVGTTDPTVRGAPIVPSSTAGACKGHTNGGITATDVWVSFGYAEVEYSSADTAGRGVCATLTIVKAA